MTIRPATSDDSESLTQISFESKRYWDYPDSYMKVWEEELTVSREYIEKNDVWVYEQEGEPIAYYSITRLDADMEFGGQWLKKGYWLDHMFVRPDCINTGVGRRLYHHLCEIYGKRKAGEIRVLADPNAAGFYQKLGARYLGRFPSNIPGRFTPLMVIVLDGDKGQPDFL